MPTRVVPDQHQHPLALLGQLRADPFQIIYSYLAHGAAFDKAQQQLLLVAVQQSITTQSCRIGVGLVALQLLQAPPVIFGAPTEQMGLFQAAPPLWLLQSP